MTGQVLSTRFEYVLLSDVHLTEIVESVPDGWWRFKSRGSAQDRVLSGLLGALDARRPERYGATWLIFNGDTLDYDSVYGRPQGSRAPTEGLPFTPEASVYKTERLLTDHPLFVAELARFLAAGNRVTFVMGNHDRELAFPEVQHAMRRAVAAAAPHGFGRRVAEAIHFEPWFFYVPGVLFAEHGQQYDGTCSYRDVLNPYVRGPEGEILELEASLGSVAGRMAIARAGTFNPFDDDSFLKGFWGYVTHAAKYYWPRHRYFSMYGEVAVRCFHDIRSRRRRAMAHGFSSDHLYDAYAGRQGVSGDFLSLLRRLASPPVCDRVLGLLHEIWLDRIVVLMMVAAILVAGLLNATEPVHYALLTTLIPVVALALRGVGRGSLALLERGRWGLVAEHVSAELDVPVVAFGHSHRPERRPLRNGGRYYNLGTWAPLEDPERDSPLSRARRYLVLRPMADGRVFVAFQRWAEGGNA